MLPRLLSPSRWLAGLLVAVPVLAAPGTARACAVCFGAPDDKVNGAMAVAIIAMLIVLAGVLGALVGFFVYLARQARRAEPYVEELSEAAHAR